ncbi:MAG TPA: PilZ domain-containing protein [Candidatus Acidoferrales bacterium]
MTIATFLATLAAALLVFLIFSQKQLILEILREKRIEKRTPAEVAVELSSVDEPLSHEKARVENTSRHGARIVTGKPWLTNSHVLVRLPRKDKPSRARIAYCSALAGDVFAIGLQFSAAVDDWAISKGDLSNGGLSHLYRK